MKTTLTTIWPLGAIAFFLICCATEAPQDERDDRVGSKDSETRAEPGESEEDASMAGEVGNVQFASVELKDFEKQPLEVKKRIYHHVLAATAGDAVTTHQRGAMNLVIRRMLDGIARAGNKVPVQIRRKIAPYRAQFFIHHGNIDSISGKRISPLFIPGELAAAAEIAINAGIDMGVDDFQGAALGANRLERLEAFLGAVRPWIFERDYQPEVPPPGQIYRAGDGGEAAPGLLSEELAAVVGHLQNGMSHMKPAKKAALEQLIHFLQTGKPHSFARYVELWLKGNAQVETFIDFFTAGSQPDGKKAEFAAMVLLRDENVAGLMHKAAGMANHYRQQMPWGKRYKKGAFAPIAPGVYNVVIATGSAGPLTKSAIAVPVDPEWAAKFGRRRLYFSNIADARERIINRKAIPEFSWNQEVAQRRLRWSHVGRNDVLVLSEGIGRGMVRPGMKKLFGAVAKPLEEMFCSLVGLYLVFDPRNQEIGLVPTDESAKAIYDSYVSGMLEQLAQVGDATALTQPEMQARQAIVRYVVNAGAAEVIQKDGRFLVRVLDYQAMRTAVAKLLQDVHRMVSAADEKGAKRLIKKFGSTFPLAWRDDVQERFDQLGLPRFIAFTYPTLVAKRDGQGRIVDVVIE